MIIALVLCQQHTITLQADSFDQPAGPTNAFGKNLEEGKILRRNGRFADAIIAFRKAADEARKEGEKVLEAEALVAKAGCEIRIFRYAPALKTSQDARSLGLQANDRTTAGAAAGNILTIYTQLGDFSAARVSAAESIDLLSQSPRKDYYALALANAADLEFALGNNDQGKSLFLKSVSVSKQAHLPRMEALASEHLGAWLTLRGDLSGAQSALNLALEISQLQHDADTLAGVYEHLAELEWRKGGPYLKAALAHIDLAFATKSEPFRISPQYYPIHIRGQILQSLGQTDKALAEFKRAVVSADTWRQSALPGDTTNIQTVVQLDSVYRDYAHLAASLALQRDDRALAREAFEVLARNRAASLREQLTRSYSAKLLDSPSYFDLLQQLQAAQASATLESDSRLADAERQKLNQIRASLSDLENKIGLNEQNLPQASEKKGSQNTLKGIQARLSLSEALLSFSLGESKSFLWAVTKEDVRLYDLPPQETIARQAQAFSQAVSLNSPQEADLGRLLSRSLFATLAPSVKTKTHWLLTPDGALLDRVPFAAIPATFEGTDKPLVASHTLRMLPSALLLSYPVRSASGPFIGVADPIYNLADSRRDRIVQKPSSSIKSARPAPAKVLGRLPASEVEIRASAERCGLSQSAMLTGKQASSFSLRQALHQTPEILHFAVHVISPPDFPQEAALALSLTSDNLPELLTAESVATLRVPGSLVVLSGCASQQGEVLPGAGLVGLSRGWLLAGAAAVVVSAWPTPDASGSFFPTFYSHYHATSGSVGVRAAIALRQTQLDMQRNGGYQSYPKFWAAYSIISKE